MNVYILLQPPKTLTVRHRESWLPNYFPSFGEHPSPSTSEWNPTLASWMGENYHWEPVYSLGLVSSLRRNCRSEQQHCLNVHTSHIVQPSGPVRDCIWETGSEDEVLAVVRELHLLSFNEVAIIKMEKHIPFVIERHKDFMAGNTQEAGTRKCC